jgi:ABC-type glycerol-3-phosphate transport system substrate-binding protein
MFRYLFFGKNCANYEASLKFAEFITSYQGQQLAATHKIMLPCYHDKSNISVFCKDVPLTEETVQREIDNADDFFSSPYFNFRFEEEVLNPTFRGYFAEQISLEETIQIIEKSDFVKNTAKKSRQV